MMNTAAEKIRISVDVVSGITAVTRSSSRAPKYISLLCLMIQNFAFIIAIRYSRTRKGDKYIMTTAVLANEVVKLVICLFIILIQEGSYRSFARHLNNNIIKQPIDCLKISIPGIIYTIQNNLVYFAVANLEATTFQVMYQLKILTTAIFSVLMLGKPLSKIQWFSLVVLFAGVSMIVTSQTTQNNSTELQISSNISFAPTAISKSHENSQKPLVGTIAVLICCVLSGFAGIYFERLLKNTPQSIFIRNIQLGTFGFVTGFVTIVSFDMDAISEKGFFFGYDSLVVFVILLQSMGGILVAIVVKYADNILKGFATSGAIVMSCIVSVFFFDFQPTWTFLLATFLVMGSVLLYSADPISFLMLLKTMDKPKQTTLT